jgi:hypothetical protein
MKPERSASKMQFFREDNKRSQRVYAETHAGMLSPAERTKDHGKTWFKNEDCVRLEHSACGLRRADFQAASDFRSDCRRTGN